MVDEQQRKMDGYGPEDMAIPTWNLLQNTGGDWAKGLGGKPGQFHNSSSDEIADELNIVVVDILMGRARWSDQLTDAGPLCASLDAKSNRSQNDDDCNQCPYRLDTPWSTEAAERRTKCCLNYTILGITINDYMPCLIRAHGISALPVRQLISQLRLNRQLKGEYFRVAVNIKSQEKKGRAGTAYALHPKIVELITDEAKVVELKAGSQRLLVTPISLPEGRPEEEPQPMGFTPQGTAFYSEEEKERLLAEEAASPAEEVATPPPVTTPPEAIPPASTTAVEAAPTTPPALPATTPPATTPPASTTAEAGKEEGEPTKPLDLDF